MVTDALIWPIRDFVYAYFATTTRAPQIDEIARQFDLTTEEASEALLALHQKHALFVEPGTARIRMANPFSAIATAFEVDVLDKTYWANCAWDSFGIVAALQSSDAILRSVCSYSGDALQLSVKQDQVISAGEVVHFLVPFKQWYEDLIFT